MHPSRALLTAALLGCSAFEPDGARLPRPAEPSPGAEESSIGAPTPDVTLASPAATSSEPLPPAAARAPDPSDTRWAPAHGPSFTRVAETGRLVIHVLVPLCHNEQVVCGSKLAGDPDNLDHNLYWGAIFGQKRFFSRKASSWKPEVVDAAPSGVLARAVFSRSFDGAPWGREAPITTWVVFDAIHGGEIDGAIDTFFHSAERGARLDWTSNGDAHGAPVDVIGYAGHNRMMDGKKPPASSPGGAPIPSFVMACHSRSWFEAALTERGSRLLASTQALMAPEGYVVDALAAALSENAPPDQLRRRTAAAYGRWQNLAEGTALGMF